nr:RNA-directed DNA polymerase, eukaryota [Tanacetum cinerariifolium]
MLQAKSGDEKRSIQNIPLQAESGDEKRSIQNVSQRSASSRTRLHRNLKDEKQVVEAGIFKGIRLNSSLSLSHLFYADDALIIGGRLTLLKSVLGASPLYCMSIFKALKGVLKEMESIRNKFFIGADNLDKKITWVAWDKVLASKKNGDLEMEKNCMVATKMAAPVDASFRRSVRRGIELVQFNELRAILKSVSLSHSHDMWIYNASSDGSFRVKDIRNLIDDLILSSGSVPTKWMKYVPIKINIFVWRARRDCLPFFSTFFILYSKEKTENDQNTSIP